MAPVWYVDITPGHDWLSTNINCLVDQTIQSGNFEGSDVAAITPYVEQMGTGIGTNGNEYRKEFWWEREWRKVGTFILPPNFIGFYTEAEIGEFTAYAQGGMNANIKFIDHQWSLEQIIAHLANIPPANVDLV